MTKRADIGTPRRSPIKQAAIDHFDALPSHCQRPFLRLLLRVRNDYPAAKARAHYAAEVAQALHTRRQS